MSSHGKQGVNGAHTTERGTRLLQASRQWAQQDDTTQISNATRPETPAEIHARGVEAGKALMRAEIEDIKEHYRQQKEELHATATQLEKQLHQATAAVAELASSYDNDMESVLGRLTALAAGKLLTTLAEQRLLTTEVVHSVCVDFRNTGGMILLMSRQDFEQSGTHLHSDFPVAVSDSLKPGEFRVSTPRQTLDLALAAQYKTLCELLCNDAPGNR